MNPSRLPIAALAVAAAVLVAAACGDDGDRPGAGAGGGPVPDAALDPAAGDEIVFSVDPLAGFVGALDAVRVLPEVVLYGDGTVLHDSTEILDSGEAPAVPQIEERLLTDEGFSALLERVAAAGVTAEVDFGEPPVTDLDSLRIQVVVDDAVVENTIYAPGFDEGLTGAQQAARAEVDGLMADLDDLDALLGEATSAAGPARVERWLALTESTDRFPDSGPGDADAILARDWPLDADRAADGSTRLACTVLEGPDLDVMLDAARSEFAETLWELDAGPGVDLVLRPALDGEDCTVFPEFAAR